ncbi:MAG: DUF4870 domain-containing protein [Pseudomonadota bacterium]
MQEEKIQPSPALSELQRLSEDLPTYAMLMHLSQFAAIVIPFVGWLAPFVMWLIKRDHEFVNQHGKLIVNWFISAMIYGFTIVALFWFMPLLSLPFLALLFISSVVFTILAAINAKNGCCKGYPLAIRFIR